MPPPFPPRLRTGIPPTIQTDPRLRTMDPNAVPGGVPPGGRPGLGRGQRFGALLAGGLGGIGEGIMTPEFRQAYQLGAGGVEGAQKQLTGDEDLMAKFKSLLDEGFRERTMKGTMT